MNEDVKSHYDEGIRVQNFNKTFKTALATIEDHAEWEAKLDTVMLEIAAAFTKQEEDDSGLVDDKEALCVVMIKSVMKYSLRAKTTAKGLNSSLILNGLSHPASYYAGSSNLIVSRATAVKDVMKENLKALTCLEIANITEMETKIADYAGAKDSPIQARQEKKTEGTDLMEPLIVRLDDAIESIADLVDSYFPDSDMSAKLATAMKLIKYVRHNIVEADFIDENGDPIAGGVLTDLRSKKTAIAENVNKATITGVRVGTGSFSAVAPGFVTQILNVKIKRGTTTVVVVKMVRSI